VPGVKGCAYSGEVRQRLPSEAARSILGMRLDLGQCLRKLARSPRVQAQAVMQRITNLASVFDRLGLCINALVGIAAAAVVSIPGSNPRSGHCATGGESCAYENDPVIYGHMPMMASPRRTQPSREYAPHLIVNRKLSSW
jgi:hypothetical protein